MLSIVINRCINTIIDIVITYNYYYCYPVYATCVTLNTFYSYLIITRIQLTINTYVGKSRGLRIFALEKLC